MFLRKVDSRVNKYIFVPVQSGSSRDKRDKMQNLICNQSSTLIGWSYLKADGETEGIRSGWVSWCYYFPRILLLLFNSFSCFLLQPSTGKYTLRGKPHTPVILASVSLIWAGFSLQYSQPPPPWEQNTANRRLKTRLREMIENEAMVRHLP